MPICSKCGQDWNGYHTNKGECMIFEPQNKLIEIINLANLYLDYWISGTPLQKAIICNSLLRKIDLEISNLQKRDSIFMRRLCKVVMF